MRRLTSSLAAVVVALSLGGSPVSAAAVPPPGWTLPLADATVVVPFQAPAHRYGPGHRGVDIVSPGASTAVVAPAAGVVAFAGRVVDRGVVTVAHGGGWVTTVEPVEPTVVEGAAVAAGDPIAVLATGGHAPAGALHVGVRWHDEYVNPLALVREIPRAVLLPCCDDP